MYTHIYRHIYIYTYIYIYMYKHIKIARGEGKENRESERETAREHLLHRHPQASGDHLHDADVRLDADQEVVNKPLFLFSV